MCYTGLDFLLNIIINIIIIIKVGTEGLQYAVKSRAKRVKVNLVRMVAVAQVNNNNK
jgi:hypothetical protein